MKKIKLLTVSLFLIAGALTYQSCETTELDLTDDPNALTPSQADPNYYINSIQVDFASTVQLFGTTASQVTRINYMNGRNYQNAFGANFFDTRWRNAYQRVIKNIREMNPIAEEKGLTKHIGMGQVFEAYMMVTLVDFFGDVPYSEAWTSGNLSPKLDSGASIYDACLALLDAAIVNFNATATANPTYDMYYDKNWETWIKLANSLKMKIYMQRRLVDPTAVSSFEAIVATGNYIQEGEDFEFKWGTNINNPNSRHPLYVDAYTPTGTNGYMSNWLMNYMKNTKAIQDPRMKFYFYRQVNNTPISEELIRCTIEPTPAHYLAGGHTFCRIPNNEGYWGRDHGNDEGTPPDGQQKTAYGLYPVGGRFDDNSFQAINGISFGAQGRGITPIFLASTVDFLRAESSLNGGTGNTNALVAAGIQKSFNKVRSFLDFAGSYNPNAVPSITLDANYISIVGTQLTNASTTAAKMNIVAKEFFVTLFGNGIDAYNFYRRTGYPNDIQPNVEPNPGGFIRSFLYPANEANTNANMTQKSTVTQRVFWDNNPETGFPANN
jgi:hypothetical protein